MEANFQEKLLTVLEMCMRPIACFMLRSGIGYREFSTVCKRAFVHVATNEYGLRGRPTNISRVAIMTGLTRKEVKKIRDSLNEETGSIILKTNPAADVLHHWHVDAEFCDEEGLPLEIPFDGPIPSFKGLVKRYGGDIPPVALMKELKRADAIDEVRQNKFKIQKRYFIPCGPDNRLLASLQNQLLGHLQTIEKNNRPDVGKLMKSGMLDRIVYSANLNKRAKAHFRRLSKQHSIELLNVLDDWISANEKVGVDAGEKLESAMGVGVYFFEEHENLKSN